MSIAKRMFFYGIIIIVSSFTFFSQVYASGRNTEVNLHPYPGQELSIHIDGKQKIIDYALSPREPKVAVILLDERDGYKLSFWDLNSNSFTTNKSFEVGYQPMQIVWHPADESLFVLARKVGAYQILKASAAANWEFKEIYHSKAPISRLIIAPRPFAINTSVIKYRLFFGVLKQGNYIIQSITEDGEKLYQVAGRGTEKFNKHFVKSQNYVEPPSALAITESILPAAFHPAGHLLAMENKQGCFSLATYGKSWASDLKPLYGNSICRGTIAFLPNGLGIMRWLPEQQGVDVYSDVGKAKATYFKDVIFNSKPVLAPDAKGIVSTIVQNNIILLVYKPIAVPLGDVANAWMFIESPTERELFVKHGGLLRSLPETTEQLYQLYDSELYSCGEFAANIPSRPYIITTDTFWEVFAAAFEGTFILIEKEKAIPHFWQFIVAAKEYYAKHDPNNPWLNIFSVIEAIKANQPTDQLKQEFTLITQASGNSASTLIPGATINYAELKPRSHYQASPELTAYFKAFKYLMLAADAEVQKPSKPLDIQNLKSLPTSVTQEAIAWIEAYLPFVSSSSRAPLIFGKLQVQLPKYGYEIKKRAEPFPLSWGFDNEIFLRGVYHADWPLKRQIAGSGGERLVPSSLDIASVLGSSLAFTILEQQGEFNKYPPLKNALNELRDLYKNKGRKFKNNTSLYDKWIDALAVQWADDVKNPLSPQGDALWQVKRLQTGLASWTTLRHVTALVNERVAAECGEGGFEDLITQFPRGFVEPDPNTFTAIAKLFAAMVDIVKAINISALEQPQAKDASEVSDDKVDLTVKQGILRRLQTMHETSLQFADMARRELKGEPLKESEYKDIFYIGRIIEHNFLIFKSLAKSGFALSNPESMAKAIDVAGGNGFPYLIAAVGKPLEWDFIYPMLGRKMIGKGAVYSFYEFTSATPIDDTAWRAKLSNEPHPSWVQPFFYPKQLSCPANDSL